MSIEKLRVIKEEAKRKNSKESVKREGIKNDLDRLWEEDPLQFDPFLSAMGRDRVKKTVEMLDEIFIEGDRKSVADLGFGGGYFTTYAREKKAAVDAVDLANSPVENLREKKLDRVKVFQDFFPKTTLEGDFYDLVLCLETIAYLPKEDYRLAFAELARLVKLEGIVMASTPISIYSEDALQNFAALAESEFTIMEWKLSYHNYYIRLLSFLEAPARFTKATHCSKISYYFWSMVKFFTNPLFAFVKESNFILLKLESFCRFLSSETGISHALFVGKRRKVFEEVAKDELPIERKGKREVWE